MSHLLYKIYNIGEVREHNRKQCLHKTVTNHAKEVDVFDCSKNTPEPYRCYYCAFKTDLLVEFNKHAAETKIKPTKRRSETVSSYICDKCNFETFSQLILLKHVYTKCAVAETNSVMMLVYLKSHESSSRRIKLINCEPSALKTQAKSKTIKKIQQQPKHRAQNALWVKCDKCSFQTQWNSSLKWHNIRKHTAPEAISWFECEQCPFKAKLKQCLATHVLKSHTASEEIKWFECAQCAYKSIWKHHLDKHHRVKHALSEEIDWFQCEFCPHRTKWRTHLKRHIQEQHTEKFDWLLCEHCPYKAKQKTHMKLHVVQRHTASEDIKWFECEQCSYKAKIKASLKSHVLKRHTSSEDIDWFVCEKCGYKVMERSLLKKHMQKKH